MSDPKLAQRAYDAWHERVADGEALDTPWHRLVQRALSAERDLTGRRVLEIACGRGELATWCAAHTAPGLLVAADFSSSAVRLARRRLAEGKRQGAAGVLQADAQRIPLPAASMDTVICCETLEHVHRPRRALAEIARVLRPGGRLFLTTPNYLGPMGAYRAYLRAVGRPFTEEGQPINHPLLAPLVRAWVRAAGFRVVQASSTGHYLPFPGRPPILLAEGARFLSPFGLHALTVAERRG